MRWTVAVVAALVLSGCSSKDGGSPAEVGIAATALEAGNVTQTVFPLQFAGGTREGELPISETFAPNDACFFGFPDCLGAAERTYDLTPIIPADVPVELSMELATSANLDINFELVDAQFIQDNEREGQGGGGGPGERFDAVVVRAPAGSVILTIQYGFPSPDSAQGFTVEGLVHTVTRAEVVPSLLPVAIELGPGDVVNATADGLEQFVAFPPSGEALRALQYPFSITVPEGGPSGTWYIIGAADEALRLTGPNRTLAARLLEFVETEPVDITANQATAFTMDVAGFPLEAGVAFQSKEAAAFLHGATLMGNHKVTLVSPDKVDVLSGGAMANCSPMCEFALIGGMDDIAYASAFLDEHLKAGTYEATVTIETSNDVQAYGFALSIKTAA